MVKPLGKQLKGIACFAGATIMGDGKVALILDVLGLAQARQCHRRSARPLRGRTNGAEPQERWTTRQTLLLFDAGQGSRMAIPLSMVARLEEFPARAGRTLRRAGSGAVPRPDPAADPRRQYMSRPWPRPRRRTTRCRWWSMPSTAAASAWWSARSTTSCRKRSPSSATRSGDGIFGSAVIQDKVTDLLDVAGIIRAADPTFYRRQSQPAAA